MRTQVPPSHYAFREYDNLHRWCSYWHQINEALALSPQTLLEVGVGSGVFSHYLRGRGIDVKTADIDESRKPDFLCSIDDLDRGLPKDLRFDVVCAFQVLEHLPHERFDASLTGLARRGRYCLLSLPHFGFSARVAISFAGIHVNQGFRLPKPWRFTPNGEHYWELDFGRHSVAATTREIERHFDVIRSYHVRENTYHHLWVLRSRTFEGDGARGPLAVGEVV